MLYSCYMFTQKRISLILMLQFEFRTMTDKIFIDSKRCADDSQRDTTKYVHKLSVVLAMWMNVNVQMRPS